jgi:DNA-binding LacI/PurR family transcriptional regulator
MPGVEHRHHKGLNNRAENSRQPPLVAVSRKTRGFSCPSIVAADEDTRLAARYLLECGHRQIGGFFGDLAIAPFRGRHKAFTAELEKAGIAVREDWIKSGTNISDFAKAATIELFSQPDRPIAFFAAGNLLTEGALLGLKQAGLRQGVDVDLIGHDLRYAPLFDPPLPVLLQPARDMGCLALDVLVGLLRGAPPIASSETVFHVSINRD